MKDIVKFILISIIPISIILSVNSKKPVTPKEVVKEVKLSTYKLYHYIVEVTMYHATEEQCGSDPTTTASGKKIIPDKKYKYIAVSRDLLKRYGGILKWGDKVKISGAGDKDGVYYVEDTMHPKWKNRIDILEPIDVKQYKFKNVKLTKL